MGCCYSRHDQGEEDDRQAEERHIAERCASKQPSELKHSKGRQFQSCGERYKKQGNQHFKSKNYKLAIQSYQQALENSTTPDISYYTNLALAFKADHQYRQGIETIDTLRANAQFAGAEQSELFRKGLITQSRCVIIQAKEYCLCGQFSLEQNQKCLSGLDQSLRTLNDISKEGTALNEVSEFAHTGNRIRLLLIQEIIPKCRSQNLINYLEQRFALLPEEDFFSEPSKVASHFDSRSQILGQLLDTAEKLKLEALEEEQDYLLDPITYQALLDPVILPSGTSYNHITLLQHFKNNGYRDPITCKLYCVGEKVLVSNLNIKDHANMSRKKITPEDLHLLKY